MQLNNFNGIKIPLSEKEIRKKYPYLTDPGVHIWMPLWITNMTENYPRIKKLFEEKNRCLTSLEKPKNIPLAVVGSGPSLDESAKYLKDFPGDIISGATTASVFKKYGRDPDYISAFDSHDSIIDYFGKFEWDKTALITHPNSSPRLLDSWKGDIYFFRRIMNDIGLYELILPLLYPSIRLGLVMTSSVTNNIITIAQFLGYSSIYLFGCDLSYTDKGRCTYYNLDKDNNLEEDILLTEDFIGHKKTDLFYYRDTESTDIITSNDFVGFKMQMYQLWNATDIPIFNCSKGSILREIPFVEPEEVIEKKGEGFEELYKGFNKNKAISDYFRLLNSRRFKGKKVF